MVEPTLRPIWTGDEFDTLCARQSCGDLPEDIAAVLGRSIAETEDALSMLGTAPDHSDVCRYLTGHGPRPPSL